VKKLLALTIKQVHSTAKNAWRMGFTEHFPLKKISVFLEEIKIVWSKLKGFMTNIARIIELYE
jgi:hypothetical protein